ncbi:MAG: hypothetical protein BWY77_01080 [bacterium ADurb.Bin431]|nr:MAG: hypothetical protein BWY77_01080 [bacterium ADurb.Bin431]
MGHDSAQLVGLRRGKAGDDLADLDHLLLEQHHPIGFFQDRFQPGMQVADLLLAQAPGHIRVDHIAFDGTRPDQGHAGYHILEFGSLEAGLQGSLGRAFQLKYADGLAPVDHGEGIPVIQGDGLVIHVLPGGADLGGGILDHRQGAQGEQVQLDQPQPLDIILVELADDRPHP